MHVVDDLKNREFRLTAMDDGENRIAMIQKFVDKSLINRFV